jgi:hypothetical protein
MEDFYVSNALLFCITSFYLHPNFRLDLLISALLLKFREAA